MPLLMLRPGPARAPRRARPRARSLRSQYAAPATWPNRELCLRRWTSPLARTPSPWPGRPAGRPEQEDRHPGPKAWIPPREERRADGVIHPIHLSSQVNSSGLLKVEAQSLNELVGKMCKIGQSHCVELVVGTV